MNKNECVVTIPQSRYEELLIAEQDANRLKGIIASKTNHYTGLSLEELRILRDLLMPVTEEEE